MECGKVATTVGYIGERQPDLHSETAALTKKTYKLGHCMCPRGRSQAKWEPDLVASQKEESTTCEPGGHTD